MFMFCGLLILFTDSFGRKYLIKTEGISFVFFVYFHWYHIKDETENMDVDTDIEGMELEINKSSGDFSSSHDNCNIRFGKPLNWEIVVKNVSS